MKQHRIIRFSGLFLLLGVLFGLAACNDWTEMEAVDNNVKKPWEQDPALWAEYTAALRDYKKSEHFIVYARLHNSPEPAASEKDFMRCLPDSLDIVALTNADNFSRYDAEDMAVMREKGTKVLWQVDYAGRAAEFADAAKLGAWLDRVVSSVAANGMDGYSFTGIPNAGDPAAVQAYSNLETNESITVKYDKQEEVYMKMFGELDEAIAAFAANTTLPAEAFSRYDRVYGGNIAQWLKYANSLKLRMAMRLSEVKPDVARTKAAEAIAAGVITANADNAAMHAAENRTTLIYNDWGDHRVGADILCYMTGYEDPRLEKMFLPNDKGDYVGIRIGIDVTSKSQAQAKYSNMIVTSSTPYLWINAAEVAFLKAEYELRWGTKDAAKALYEQAIRLSFEDKGAKDADAYIADKTRKPAAYNDPLGNYSATALSSITIAWEDDSAEGADKAAIKERNLERIITQKWIAIFPLGVEAWSEHRRTGYPRLLPAVEDKSGGTVDLAQGARRLPYPVEEYDKNNANLQEAVQMLNSESQGSRKGDGMGTRVWWDVKPYNN